MKKHLYLTGALVLLLVLVGSATLVSADQSGARPAAQTAGTLEGPRWVLVSYATSGGKMAQAIPGAEATAQFENNIVHGTTGCNNYEAPYEAKDGKLTVGVTATTMKMCPPPIMDQESAYLAAIQAAASYKIADGTLTIANAKGNPVLTYKAETPISLTGGTWVMTGYNNGKQAVVSALPDTEVTAIFGADGNLGGSAGCNTYNASYKVDGNKIKIGAPITTRMACEQPIMDQEALYLAAIQTAATYKIEGDKLELRSAADALVASYTLKAEQGAALVGPTWVMTSYNNGKGGVVSASADTEVTAIFGETGKLSGSGGCNTYNAPYAVDGAKIKIGPAMSTMMACPQPIMDQEAAYLAAIQTAATYKIEGDKLELRKADGALAASFTQQVASSLVGPTWVMTSYNNGKGGVVSASPDTEVTAIFGETGKLSGSAGCNTYNAPYAVDGAKIKIGPGVTTMMACEQAIMDQEAAYLAALQTAATYKIQGTKLELRKADGALAASFTQQVSSPLVGPTWMMIGYNNGKQAVVSAAADTEVTAIFGADGNLSGSGGCNTYNAPYATDGAKIKIGPAVTTRMACEQPIMDQETLYLAALQTAATYKVEGERLQLRTADGALAVDYIQQAAAEPQPAAAPAPAAATAPAVAAPAPQGPEGTYLTLRPTANGGLATLALQIKSAGAAELTSSSTDQAPIMQTGTWKDNGDETLTVTLTDVDGKKMAKPTVVKFKREGTFLNAVEYDKAVYGAEGLKLNLAADVARKVGPALMTLDLAAGFPLDPTFMSVNGGGEVDASLLSPECKGFINRNPIVTVNWTGNADLLRSFFYSDSDSTLVVLTPDGKLVCNDNANEQLLDPVLDLKNPIPGKYRIWVGSAANRQRIPGVLVLTTKPELNLDTFELAKLVRRPQIPVNLAKPAPEVAADAIKKDIEAAIKAAPVLKPGATLTADVTAEGKIPLFQFPLTKTCAGLVSAKPSYVFKVVGQLPQMSIYFEGDADSTLLVIGNDLKTVECNDDTEPGKNINPQVRLSNPAEGAYAVFVGRLDPSKPVKGTLRISAAVNAEPVPAPAQK